MRACALFLSSILLLFALAPATAGAQMAGEVIHSYPLYVDEMVSCFGIANHERVVLVNTMPVVILRNPLVIVGSGAGLLEQNGFNTYTSIHTIDGSFFTVDGVTGHAGKPLSSYDLLLIGGPEHNAMTKQFMDQGILQCTGTDIKMPGMVLEVVQLPDNRKIVVIGEVSGYPYHKKDLPLNDVVPETMAPAAAIALGTGLGALGAMISASGIFSWLQRKIRGLRAGYRKAHTAEAASESFADAASPDIHVAGQGIVLGVSLVEIITLFVCCILFGGIYLLADRVVPGTDIIILYMIMGTIAVIVHDLGHQMVASKLNIAGKCRFWGTGTVAMLLTSWLFGMAFAQPAKYVFSSRDKVEKRDMLLVTLAGPAVSLLFAILFLPFALIGGVAGQIAVAGFTMNLMTVVYNMMPFRPMDGKVIYEWSRLFWMLMFMPLALFFILMTLFFV